MALTKTTSVSGISLKVKSILVTQPKPETDKSPYYDLAKKCNVKIDFRPFIHVEPIAAKDFRKDRVNILDYSAVIFTSRNAVYTRGPPPRHCRTRPSFTGFHAAGESPRRVG